MKKNHIQVHKAVLNMLIFMDLELLPLKNSDRAWSWAGCNYAESAGEQETLAVRFKSVDLATAFRDKVVECVRVCALHWKIICSDRINTASDSKVDGLLVRFPFEWMNYF